MDFSDPHIEALALGLVGPMHRERDGDSAQQAGKWGADDATWLHRLVDRTAGAPLPARWDSGYPLLLEGHRR